MIHFSVCPQDIDFNYVLDCTVMRISRRSLCLRLNNMTIESDCGGGVVQQTSLSAFSNHIELPIRIVGWYIRFLIPSFASGL